jgi:DNA-binding transcriptional LysR family regulator
VAGERFISFTSNNAIRQVTDQAFERAGVERRLVAETQYCAAMAELVAQGVGIGLIDPFTAADFAGRGVTAIAFEPKIPFHVGILYPSHRSLSRAARNFISVLRRHRNHLLGAREQRNHAVLT